jgi:enoyl-CoA hydratase/carnithine racemase
MRKRWVSLSLNPSYGYYPEEAAREGLVHHFIEGDVLAAARGMAREFVDRPPSALAYIKQLVRSSLDQSITESLDQEDAAFVHLIAHDERCRTMMKDYVAGSHKLEKL